MNRRLVACVMLVFLVAGAATALAGCLGLEDKSSSGNYTTLYLGIKNVSHRVVNVSVNVVFQYQWGKAKADGSYCLKGNTTLYDTLTNGNGKYDGSYNITAKVEGMGTYSALGSWIDVSGWADGTVKNCVNIYIYEDNMKIDPLEIE